MHTIRYALLLGGILIGCLALAASANAAQGWYQGGYGHSSGYGHYGHGHSGGYGGGFGWNGYGFQPRYHYGHSYHGQHHGGHHHGHRR